ncbi:hypothetical protein QJS10_CPB15g00372 [Acorus calamus]|uniref:Uncharacterized protein n=1 Tax=Acorus calamus TaxID=4465 RepID=A0AAV9D7J1_ACOCL|nr:hypothetical protein QJS10_CPB15g00372 [Acorus calamus]
MGGQQMSNGWQGWIGERAEYEPVKAQQCDRIRGRFVLYNREESDNTIKRHSNDDEECHYQRHAWVFSFPDNHPNQEG